MFTNTAAKDNISVFLWLISCCVYKPLLMPIICWWAPELFACPGYCKQCCYEHWGACIFFELEFLFFQDICLGVELLDHMVTLKFLRSFILLSIMAAPIYIPTNNVQGFLFSTSSPAFVICRLLDNGHSNRCQGAPHCRFL